MTEAARTYGVLAEFAEPEALLRAARSAYAAGYRAVEAYSPFPVEGLAEATGVRGTKIPLVTLLGGIVGGILGYGLAYYVSVIAYPINVGGRPLNSWPAFVPVTFEMTVLVAAVGTFVMLLVRNGLPQPYHPVFNATAFARGSRDRFFLCIQARDPRFDRVATRELLASLQAIEMTDVPA